MDIICVYLEASSLRKIDLRFNEDNKLFGFRSTGVLIHNGRILIQRGVDDTEFALPGGCVAWGETSAETLVREFKEELGVDIVIKRLIWVEEVFWKWGDKNAHTLCHYHLIALTDVSQIPNEGIIKSLETDESRLLFQWVDINKLGGYNTISHKKQ
ncbi:MAG: hypothetical protein A2Y17_08600 [Clostridiales bacterium GWF2_38_85]|nr:MAG: hypothetical protein A2Y17_08600 [Clostridiales bacterium GWF2_38_85]HBL83746.1 hypothetical protein [Clostridiales bacterium]